MKKIGILGGLCPESTVTYYLHICRKHGELYGDAAFPEIVIYSLCLEKYDRWRIEGSWDEIVNDLARALRYMEKCDVDVAAMATNTIHKVFDEVQATTAIRLVSIVEAVVDEIRKSGITSIGLLGTKDTMTGDFYRRELNEAGISCLIPDRHEMDVVDRIINDELTFGKLTVEARTIFIAIIDRMIEKGAEGIVLGCTEIPLLIKQEFVRKKVFDTAIIHAQRIFDYAYKP